MGDNCTVWYGAVIRGDDNSVEIGDRVNVQDNATIHTTYRQSVTILEDDVSIGHNAVIHGAHVGKGCLIGMGAVLLDNARIAPGSIVAAGAVVLAKSELDQGIYAGIPAKKVKDGSPELTEKAGHNAKQYMMYKDWFK